MPCSPVSIKEKMMAISILGDADTSSYIECVKYVPLTVVYDSNTDTSRHVMFMHDDSDCLEFALDWKTGRVKKVKLVLCNHVDFLADEMPLVTAPSASLAADFPKVNSCDKFSLVVYKDGIDITVSPKSPAKRVRSGQIIFELSEDGSPVRLLIMDMTPSEIRHTIVELEADKEASAH